jgi:hypothetical protein
LAFSQDGRLGFALLVKNTLSSAQLFSFSVEQGSVTDLFDLAPDFGIAQNPQSTPLIFIKAITQPAVVLAYGRDTAGHQKVLALTYDSAGHLSRDWVQTYPGGGLFRSSSDVVAAPDGSRVFVSYADLAQSLGFNHIDLLETRTGAILSTHELPGIDLSLGKPAGGMLVFDESHMRLIAVSLASAFVFRPGLERLDLDGTITASDSLLTLLIVGRSADGRFVLTDGGFRPTTGAEVFVTYDLCSMSSSEFDFPAKLFGISNDFVFNEQSGLLVVPPKLGSVQGGTVLGVGSHREIRIYRLGPDGSITLSVDFDIPKRSSATAAPNAIGLLSTVSLSSSGALGFVPTTSGSLLAFDTLTGDIVDEQVIGTNTSTSIQLLEAQGLLSFTNGTNSLSIIDISTGPAITSAKVRMASTTLIGAKFLFGARVKIDGVDVGEVTRDPNDPGRRIILNRGKRDFPPGQPFTITVVNRDGLISNSFVITR